MPARSATTKLRDSVRSQKKSVIVFTAVWLFLALYGFVDIVSGQRGVEEVVESSKTALSPVLPTRIMIPALGVDASIEAVGKKTDGAIRAPSRADTVAWYADGPRPGDAGTAVFAGHLNTVASSNGVFKNLRDLHLGDQIVIDGQGGTHSYTVRAMTIYDADASTENLFMNDGPSHIVLVTCDGVWDEATRTYTKRLVVIAE